MSYATSTYEMELAKLNKDTEIMQKKFDDAQKTVFRPDLFNDKTVKDNVFPKVLGELSAVMITVVDDVAAPVVGGVQLSQQAGSSNPQNGNGALNSVSEKLEAVGSDWKSKLVFIFVSLAVIIGAIVLGLTGSQVPVVLPDGNFSVSTNAVYGDAGLAQTITGVQMVNAPVLPIQWVVAIVLFALVFAFLPYLGPWILAYLAKPIEDEPVGAEALSKHISETIKVLLDRYLGLYELTHFQTATRAAMPDYADPDVHEAMFSRKAQNLLTYPSFAIIELTKLRVACNSYALKHRIYLYNNIAAVNGGSNSSSALAGKSS